MGLPGEPEGSTTHASGQKPRSARRWPRALVPVALVALAGGIGYFVWRQKHGASALAPEPTRDVPRIEGRAVVVTDAFRDRAAMRSEPAARSRITPVLRVVGTVTFDPSRVAAVGTRSRGFVRKVAKLEGDPVRAGEELAELESADLGQAQADVASAAAHRRAAEQNAKRERDLLARGLTTAREAEVAEATLDEHKAALDSARQRTAALGGNGRGKLGVHSLVAPIAGTVVERHVSAGQTVEGPLVAFRVADLDRLWIELSVFERNVGSIRTGDHVEVTPVSESGAHFEGKVAHVGEVIDEATRTAAVRVTVQNEGRKLRPGQSVMASIRTSGPSHEAVLVRKSAVTFVDGKATVFVEESPRHYVPVAVRLGLDDGAHQEVLEGLQEGALVVVSGVFALKSELFR